MYSVKNTGKSQGVVTIGGTRYVLNAGKSMTSKVRPTAHTISVRVVEIPTVATKGTAVKSTSKVAAKAAQAKVSTDKTVSTDNKTVSADTAAKSTTATATTEAAATTK